LAKDFERIINFKEGVALISKVLRNPINPYNIRYDRFTKIDLQKGRKV
jgi:hypothetical protein